MYTLGIDVGSSSSKAVILEDGKNIIAQAVIEIGTGSTVPVRVLQEVFKGTNLTLDDMENVIATGYGRFNVIATVHRLLSADGNHQAFRETWQ